MRIFVYYCTCNILNTYIPTLYYENRDISGREDISAGLYNFKGVFEGLRSGFTFGVWVKIRVKFMGLVGMVGLSKGPSNTLCL